MLRKPLHTRPLVVILAATMLVVALACGGEKAATPTSLPTATATVAATATPVPEVDLEALPWVERLMLEPGYKPEWGKPVYGGTFVNGTSYDITDLYEGSCCRVPTAGLYNGLLRFHPWVGTSLIIGDLAKSWELSKDALQISLELNKGVKFHNNPNIPERLRNADFTCEDVQASFEFHLRPPKGESLSTVKRGMSQVTDVTCPDGPLGYTVVLRQNAPLAKTMGNLAHAATVMWDKGWLEWMRAEYPGLMANATSSTAMMATGTGPFTPKEFERSVVFELRANPNYFRKGLPLLDGQRFQTMYDATLKFAALVTGKIHWYGPGSDSMLPGQIAQAERDFPDQIVIHTPLYNIAYGVSLNRANPPWNDVRARRAANLVVDRDVIKNLKRAGSRDMLVYSANLIMPGSYFGHTEEEYRTWPGIRPKDSPGGQEDLAEANRLMDEVFGKGVRFTTACSVQSSDQVQVDDCLFFGDQMKRHLGVDVEMRFYETAVARVVKAEGSFQIWSSGVANVSTGDPDDNIFTLFHRKYQTSHWAPIGKNDDPAHVEAIEAEIMAMSLELDRVKRRELSRALEKKLFLEEAYVVPNGWTRLPWGTVPNLGGFAMQDNQTAVGFQFLEGVWFIKK